MGRTRGLKKPLRHQPQKLTKLTYDGHLFYNERALDIYKLLEDYGRIRDSHYHMRVANGYVRTEENG